MTVGELIVMLKKVPRDRDVAIVTPNPKFPGELEWGDLWTIVGEELKFGTEGVILEGRRHKMHGG
jgi:hypothetical protein